MNAQQRLNKIASNVYRLRKELTATIQESSGESYYVVEDPVNAKFYRVGMREWNFARQFDGSQSLGELLHRHLQDSNALSNQQAFGVVQWMLDADLLFIDEEAKAAPKSNREKTESSHSIKKKKWSASQLLFLRVPLLNPDRMLAAALPYSAWMVTPVAVLVSMMLWISGGMHLIGRLPEFSNSMGSVISVNNWMWLIVTWLLLKIVHEFFHGIVCKKYGGRVPQCGIVLILFSPIAFVDVTSSWRFRYKWERIWTSSAGMYAEFTIAGIAAWVWAYSEPGLTQQICQNVIVAASISTLLFNGNFLMKFDGYYILADLLGIQNLYENGVRYVNAVKRRIWFGLPTKQTVDSNWRGKVVKAYGIASFVWRWVFMVSIVILASKLFYGLGLILAVVAIFSWWCLPIVRLAKYLVHGNGSEQPNRWQFAKTCFALLTGLAATAMLPWPFGVSAPAVVEYAPLHSIYASAPGFVERVEVASGQFVKAGTPLMSLRNDKLLVELHDLELQIKISKKREQIDRHDIALRQQHQKETVTLQERYEQVSKRVNALNVVAPEDGHVIGKPEDLLGSFFREGELLLAVGNQQEKELKLSIAEDDVRFFSNSPHSRICVRGVRQRLPKLTIRSLTPKASTRVPHHALSATSSGPLLVTTSVDSQASENEVALLSPRFEASIALPTDVSRHLFAGQLAKVRVATTSESIAQYVFTKVTRWLRTKVEFSY